MYQGEEFSPPLDRDFFKSEVVKHIFTNGAYPVLHYYQDATELEALWAKVDLYYKLCNSGIISEEKTYFELLEGLRNRAATDSAYRRKMERESRALCTPSLALWELVHLVREVFQGLKPPDKAKSPLYKLINNLQEKALLGGVITFNYDTAIEQLFLDHFYYPLLSDLDTRGKFPLMKLHGALNWQFHTKSDPPIFAVQSVKEVAKIDYQNQLDYKQPEVIGPTFFKQEINVDIQFDFRGSFYKRLWAIAWDRLRQATHLIFVGFSFPKADFHAAALCRTAHLSGDGIEKVILCYKKNKEEENLRSIVEAVFVGGPTKVKFPEKDFDEGLENVDLDKLVNELVG